MYIFEYNIIFFLLNFNVGIDVTWLLTLQITVYLFSQPRGVFEHEGEDQSARFKISHVLCWEEKDLDLSFSSFSPSSLRCHNEVVL